MNARMTLALALGAVLALAGCAAKHEDGRAAGASDTAGAPMMLASSDVATAARTDLLAGVPVSGTLAPDHEAQLTSPVDDLVQQVLVREGERVAAGQVLARFRQDDVRTAAVSAAAQLEVAAADVERMRNLFAEGAASKRDVETAEAAWRSTDAQNAAAAKRLADATVRAPFAGTVSRRAVQAGDRVASGDPMFTVVNTSVLEFEASVPTEYIASVKPGARVRLSVTGYTAGELGGEVARVNATADPATRQVQVYVRVPNRKGELVGGLFASGDIVTNQSHEALSVPAPAIRTEGDATYAIVIEAGRLARRAISIGVRDDGRGLVEVKSGLEAGDVVLTGPLEGLVPGQRVTVGGKES